jgi:hypothetical protein
VTVQPARSEAQIRQIAVAASGAVNAQAPHDRRANSGPLATVSSGQPRLLRSMEVSRSAVLTAMRHTPSKLVMRVRFPSPAPPKSAGHSPGNGAATVPGPACGSSSFHMGAQWRLIGRSLAWLPAVPGHGASLNGGYRSVTRTNAQATTRLCQRNTPLTKLNMPRG